MRHRSTYRAGVSMRFATAHAAQSGSRLTRDEVHDALRQEWLGVRTDQLGGTLERLPRIKPKRSDQIGGGDRRRAVLRHHAMDEDPLSGGDTVRDEVGRVGQYELEIWIVGTVGVDESDDVVLQMVGHVTSAHPTERYDNIGLG